MKTCFGALAALVLVAGAFLPATATAYTPLTDADGDVIEPDPYVTGNVTISNHRAECDDDVLCYEDDSGDLANLADDGLKIHLERVDEPVRFSPGRVDCQYYGEDSDAKSRTSGWCGNVSDKSWLDTANWVNQGDVESSDTKERVQRNGAHALHFKNVGVTNSVQDTDSYIFDFADLVDDPGKYRLIIGVEVVDAGDDIQLNLYDSSVTSGQMLFGFRETGAITNQWIANKTGVYFFDPIANSGSSSGGGIPNGIGKIQIVLRATAASGAGTTSATPVSDIYIYALAIQTKRYEFGVDDNSEVVYNMTADNVPTVASYVDLAEFDPSFDYQNIKDLRVSYILTASSLPEDNIAIVADETSDETFPWKTNYRFGFEIPKMIDLTYAGDEAIKYALPVGGAQHELVEVASVDKIKEVEKKRTGDIVTLASTLAAGKETEVEMTVLYTDAQMLATTEVQVLGIISGVSFLGQAWVWLSGLAIVGVFFARGLGRRRKGSR